MSRALLFRLLCSHLLATSPSVCQGARVFWADRAAYASATLSNKADDVAEAAQTQDEIKVASEAPESPKEVEGKLVRKNKRRPIPAFALETPDSGAQAVEKATIDYEGMAGKEAEGVPERDSSDSTETVVADKQRESIEEKNKHKPVKTKRRSPPPFALENSDSEAQELEKAQTDYNGMAGKEGGGVSETDSSDTTVTVVAHKQKESMEEQGKHKPVKNKRQSLSAFALEVLDSPVQEVEKAAAGYEGMTGKEAAAATAADTSNSRLASAAHKQRENMEKQNKQKPAKNKRRPLSSFALEVSDSPVREVEKSATDDKGMAGKDSAKATVTANSWASVAMAAHKQKDIKEEQNKHKFVKKESGPPPAVALERLVRSVQEVYKATTDHKGLAGKEVEGETDTASSDTLTTESDSSNTPGKYKVGDVVEYNFGEGDPLDPGNWVDAQVRRIYDSGSMVIDKDFRSHGGSSGSGDEHGRESIVLSKDEILLRVIPKLRTPTDMMDDLTTSFISASPSLAKVVVKGIAMQLVGAVTKQFTQFVDCTPFTRITKQQWAEYSKKDVHSTEVEDIFRGANEITFMQFAEATLKSR